jgi:hypothetical protein
LRAPPVPSNESDGPGGAGEPRHAQSGAVLRPSRGGPLFLERPVAALADLACRPASYRRARRAPRPGRPSFSEKGSRIFDCFLGLIVYILGSTRAERASCLLGRGKQDACPTFKQAGRRVLPKFPPEQQPFQVHASARSVLSRFPEALTHRN